MMPTDVADPLTIALGLVREARARALVAARRDPGSTWIDAYAAINRAEGHLALAAPGAAADAAPVVDGGGRRMPAAGSSCRELLDEAESVLASVTPGQGPASMVLVRAYLTDAIIEVAGREP